MKTIILAITVTYTVLFTVSLVRSDEPLIINLFCADPKDKVFLAALPMDCDLASEKYGFLHGVIRPQNQTDPEFTCTPPERAYVCFVVAEEH